MGFTKFINVFTVVNIVIIIIAENSSADSKYDYYYLMQVRI